MTFWQWFKVDGGKALTFLALSSVALQNVDGLPAWASRAVLISGILATAAHQSFFPNAPQGQKTEQK